MAAPPLHCRQPQISHPHVFWGTCAPSLLSSFKFGKVTIRVGYWTRRLLTSSTHADYSLCYSPKIAKIAHRKWAQLVRHSNYGLELDPLMNEVERSPFLMSDSTNPSLESLAWQFVPASYGRSSPNAIRSYFKPGDLGVSDRGRLRRPCSEDASFHYIPPWRDSVLVLPWSTGAIKTSPCRD